MIYDNRVDSVHTELTVTRVSVTLNTSDNRSITLNNLRQANNPSSCIVPNKDRPCFTTTISESTLVH